MNRNILIMFFFISSLFLGACQKNMDLFVASPGQLNGPDTNWYYTITPSMSISSLRNDLLMTPYHDSIDVSNADTVIIPGWLYCMFPVNCCVNNAGQIIIGKVDVEVFLIKHKGDMIRMNKPTTSFNKLLINEIEIFVKLLKGVEEVQLAPNKQISLKYISPSPNALMDFFVGNESNYNYFDWLPNPDIINNTITTNIQEYKILTNHLRWVSLNYFYDIINVPQTIVTADIASNFTNTNTIVFAVFKNLHSVVDMQGDFSIKKFSTGKVPVGEEITVVAISKQGNDYYLGFESAITASGSSQQITVKPIKKTLSEILYFLNSL